jgi:hypothetical protein
MSSDCFSVLAILILHRFDLSLHASPMMLFPYSMSLLLFFFINKKIKKNKKKKLGEKM